MEYGHFCLGSFLGERKFQFQGSLSSAHNTITLHPVTGSRTDSMLQLFPPHNLGGICKVSRQTAWIASAILGWIFLTPHDPPCGLLKTTSLWLFSVDDDCRANSLVCLAQQHWWIVSGRPCQCWVREMWLLELSSAEVASDRLPISVHGVTSLHRPEGRLFSAGSGHSPFSPSSSGFSCG